MKTSVCMATYNGSQYVEEQIASILHNMSENDELIVVDDCSFDDTVNIIRRIKDSRIKLFQNKTNLGVSKNFEQAIMRAAGDVIFISDQDDVWMLDKIQKIIQLFVENKDVTLIITDAQVIDGHGNLIAESFMKSIGAFIPGIIPNLVRSGFHGCTLAFKRKILDFVLPFPKDIPMYDMWIGLANEIYGKAYYAAQPLIKYRRHGRNATSGRCSSVVQMIKWRYALIKNLFVLILKNGIPAFNK